MRTHHVSHVLYAIIDISKHKRHMRTHHVLDAINRYL
jgi:hypothetical protein